MIRLQPPGQAVEDARTFSLAKVLGQDFTKLLCLDYKCR